MEKSLVKSSTMLWTWTVSDGKDFVRFGHTWTRLGGRFRIWQTEVFKRT